MLGGSYCGSLYFGGYEIPAIQVGLYYVDKPTTYINEYANEPETYTPLYIDEPLTST